MIFSPSPICKLISASPLGLGLGRTRRPRRERGGEERKERPKKEMDGLECFPFPISLSLNSLETFPAYPEGVSSVPEK